MNPPSVPGRARPTGAAATQLVLRPWQRRALDRFLSAADADFLTVATPGAGKTTFALTAALLHLREFPGHRVIVVAPTAHLRRQWARAASSFRLHLTDNWTPPPRTADISFPADMHGLVTTYQAVAGNADALRRLSSRAFVILDELHHAGTDRAWGDAVHRAFQPAPRRLALSGTPFRSDDRAIPFIRYREGGEGAQSEPDFEYGYADALADGGVVRPVYFPRINGFMEWVAPDGSINAASFDDALDPTGAAHRLRTALSVQGDWLPDVLGQANERLHALRMTDPAAGGLVIATDQEHARGIADLIRARLRVHATIATSDDPDASDRIAHFAAGTQPWIIAVRMISEGVDIPRLRIGVFATTTTTELFFRQAVGRFVRWTGGRAAGPAAAHTQKAFLFIPDDLRLRTWAHDIAVARHHVLRPPRPPEDDDVFVKPPEDPLAQESERDEPEQLSLFTALTAVVTDAVTTAPITVGLGVFEEDPDGAEGAEPGVAGIAGPDTPFPGAGAGAGAGAEQDGPPPELVLELDELFVPLAGDRWARNGDTRTRQEVKDELRARNAELAAQLVRFTGLEHRHVHGELNRLSGIRRVDDATIDQLERRAQHARRWLDRL